MPKLAVPVEGCPALHSNRLPEKFALVTVATYYAVEGLPGVARGRCRLHLACSLVHTASQGALKLACQPRVSRKYFVAVR